MKDFNYGGKRIEFQYVTGVVLGSEKHSETHVSSSGGGGYIGDYSGSGGAVGGYVNAPTIDSVSVTNHEFWLMREDGLEQSVQMSGKDIPLRAGQKITLISASRKGKQPGWYSILVNHNAGSHWLIANAAELNKLLKIEVFSVKTVFLLLLIIFSVAYLTDTILYGRFMGLSWDNTTWGLALGAAGIYIIYKEIKKEILLKKLKRYMENLAQHALSSVPST